MKNGKWREHISYILYMLAFFAFLGGITAESRGSMLDFSSLARALCCGFAAICVIAGVIIWKAKDARGKKIKIGIMIGALLVIVVGGIIDSKTDNTAAVEHQYIHKTYKGVVTEYENSELAIHYYLGTDSNGKEFNNRVTFYIGEETLDVPEDLAVGDEVIIESEYWTYSEQPYPAILITKARYATAMEEAVEHDLSSVGELVVSETIEKDEVFIVSPDVCTNSEEISVTNNGTEDLTIYLYNFGEVIRQMSLIAGDTKVIDGLSEAFPYKLGVSAEDSVQVELIVTD